MAVEKKDVLGGSSNGYVVDLSKPGSKQHVLRTLKRLGLDLEAEQFKLEAQKEFLSAKVPYLDAKEKAWEEMVRWRLPKDEGVRIGVIKEVVVSEDGLREELVDASVPCGSVIVVDKSFGLLPAHWPVLPETAAWKDELEWAYQNGFFVISEKASGLVSYLWDRATTVPPSRGALLLMKLLAENRQKFMDLLGKCKSGDDGAETELVRWEKRRIEEIEAMIRKAGEKV